MSVHRIFVSMILEGPGSYLSGRESYSAPDSHTQVPTFTCSRDLLSAGLRDLWSSQSIMSVISGLSHSRLLGGANTRYRIQAFIFLTDLNVLEIS